MGLMPAIQRKAYRWQWQLRHWWLDTESGRDARIAVCSLAALAAIIELVRMAVVAFAPAAVHQPHIAPVWWVVQLIIAIVSAIISYAMMPKPEPPKPTAAAKPTVEDGQSVIEVHGTYWIRGEFILADKVVGRIPIKSGGKK